MEQRNCAPKLRTLWLLAILFAATVQASTIKLNKIPYETGCVRQCRTTKDNSLFGLRSSSGPVDSKAVHFEQGKTYVYTVKSSNEAHSLSEQQQQQTGETQNLIRESLVDVQCRALFTAINECEVSMQLDNVQLNFKDAQNANEQDQLVEQFVRQLETPIVFGYQNGIVSELCTSQQQEDVFALNLKKSIISALQTTPKVSTATAETVQVVETDFNGECETEYTVDKQSWSKYLITKQKDLTKCLTKSGKQVLNQNQIESLLEHNIRSLATCQQVVENNQIQTAQCVSTRTLNTLMPHFDVELISRVELTAESVQDASDYTITQQWTRHPHRLMMIQPITINTHMLRSQANTVRAFDDGRVELKNILNQICTDIQNNGKRVTTNTARYVRTLAQTFEQCTAEEVSFVWKNMVQTNTICDYESKKLLDIFVDTAASVMNHNVAGIVRDQLIKHYTAGDVTSLKRTRYLATLIAFSTKPTTEAVKEILPELFTRIDDPHTLLSLSALAKKTKYMQVDDVHFFEQLYQKVLDKTFALIAANRAGEKEAEIVRLLNALENIVPYTEVAGQKRLATIFTDKRYTDLIRVAAIKSLEGIEINAQVRQQLLNVFADRVEKNEVRIVAYRTLVYSHVTVYELRQILDIVKREQESNRDIYNYICSHQKNLRSTDDLTKRGLIPLDAPLFPEPESITHFFLSRNFEWSFVNPKTTIGAIVEADLVMPKESRVPRAVTFNLTVPVANKQISVVEVTLRQEGMERSLMERMDKLKQMIQKPATMLRELSQLVRAQQQTKLTNDGTLAKIQVLLNIDGKNVFMWDSAEARYTEEEQWENIWTKLMQQLPLKVDETMVMMPLKHRVPIQTASGIPVTFELNTTLVCSFEANVQGQKSVNSFFEMFVKPTFVAEFSVGLEADVYSVINKPQNVKQIQFVSRFITAPTFHLKTEIKENKQLRVKVLMPETEQTLARFETEFHRGSRVNMIDDMEYAKQVLRQQKQLLLNKNNYNSGSTQERCLPVLERVLGFTFCYKHLTGDDLRPTLTTEASKQLIHQSELKLVKTDTQMEGVEIVFELPEAILHPRNVLNERELRFVCSYDTPNSAIKRHYATELLVRIPQRPNDKLQVQFDVNTPYKKFNGNLVLINEINEKGLRVEFVTDRNVRQFLLEASAVVAVKDQSNAHLKLKLRVQPTEQSPITALEGEIVLKSGDHKKHAQIKFEANDRTVFDLALIQVGEIFEPVDCKMSASLKIDMFGILMNTNGLVTKDARTGAIKSTGQLQYNRFWQSKRFLFVNKNTDTQLETIKYVFQFIGLNRQTESLKKFLHWSFTTTQYPLLNNELTYTINGLLKKELSQELEFKWSEQYDKKIRIVHQTRNLQNPRNRYNVKYDTQVEIEITPLQFNYGINCVIDVNTVQPFRQVFTLKAENKQNGQTDLDVHFEYKQASQKPLLLEAQGDIKVLNGKYVFQYQDSLKEVSGGVFQGQSQISLSAYNNEQLHRFVPKKVQLNYLYKQKQDQKTNVDNIIYYLLKNMEQFEHELIIENDYYGQVRHQGVISVEGQQRSELKYTIKSALEYKQQQLYGYTLVYIPGQYRVVFDFETIRFDQLRVQYEAQMNKNRINANVRVENKRFQHKTEATLDKKQYNYELSSETKYDTRTVFLVEAKKEGKLVHIKVDSQWIKTDIELDNVFYIVRQLIRNEQLGNRQSRCKIVIVLPVWNVEHKTLLNTKSTIGNDDVLVIESQTLKNNQNLFKCAIQLGQMQKTIEIKSNGYDASLKLIQKPTEQNIYELEMVIRAERQQVFHNTVARWSYTPNNGRSYLRQSGGDFKLYTLNIKNHLQDKNLLDLYYRYEQDSQYVHQLTISGRDSHLEFQCSELFGRKQTTSPQCVLVFKTKKFGGIDHKTELKQININEKTFKLYSNTIQNGLVLADVQCELALTQGKQSHIMLNLFNQHKIEARFVPFEMFEAQCDIADRWNHQIKFVRNVNDDKWTVEIECLNKKYNDKWTARCEHKCYEYTTLAIESPVIRGNGEIRLNEKTIRVELKGDKQLRGFEHKTNVRFNTNEKMIKIQSNTMKSGNTFVVVDGELYLDLFKQSTLNMQIEPINFKCYIECDPTVGGEMRLTYKQFVHNMQIKKRSNELILNSETRNNGKLVALFDGQLSLAKIQFKCELGLNRFPVTINGKVDIDDREMNFELHNKLTDRLIKLEAKLNKMSHMYIECAWDAKRDQSKQVVFDIRVQDKSVDPKRVVVTAKGKCLDREFDMKIDLARKDILRSMHKIDIEYKNRETNEQYTVDLLQQYENEICYTKWECRKNQMKLVKGEIKIDIQDENKRSIRLNCESDLDIDFLNVRFELNRECVHDDCHKNALVEYGVTEKKQIKFECHYDSNAIRGEFNIDMPQMRKQTVKFEWIKPESKLQINIYNEAGRQLDINVDITKALQKKFQIVSFIESIPTVDIEAAYGENSRIVLAVSFQQEKKMELSLNWFGQWRRDFKLEALFKCFSKPSLELLVTSRHPAGMDQIEAVLKIQNKEYVGKWSRRFELSKNNWNTQTLIEANGQKKLDLELECVTKIENQRQVIVYKTRLDGLYQTTGKVQFVLNTEQKERFTTVEMVKFELGNQQEANMCNVELYLAYQEQAQSPVQTGVKFELHDKPVFALIYVNENRINAQNKRSSIVHIQLPIEIEYILRNEIQYKTANQIESIRSELKKKTVTQNSEPIYQTRVIFDQDTEEDMKVMRVEINSYRFQQQKPKVIEIRYNLNSKKCYNEQYDKMTTYGQKECTRFEIVAGENIFQNQYEQSKINDQTLAKNGFKISYELMKYPIDQYNFNRTVRFSIESMNREQTVPMINFNVIGHVSAYAAGLKWQNINRYGVEKSGMIYFGTQQPQSYGQTLFDLIVRCENKQQPSKNFAFDLHFNPKDIRRTMKLNAKWDQSELRSLIVGKMPQIEELTSENMNKIQARIVRELNDEIQHKISYLTNTFDHELLMPVVEEAAQVQQQMEESEQEVAQKIARVTKVMQTKANQLWNSIDLEQFLTEIANEMDNTIEQYKQQILTKIEEECENMETCHRLLNQFRDYEIEKFIHQTVERRAEQMHQIVEQYVPQGLLEAFKDLYQTIDQDEQQNQYEINQGRPMMKHTIRLLKMARPEIADNLMHHFGTIMDQFHQQQNKINWPVIRGSLHDMAVEVADNWQDKCVEDRTQESEQEEKPMWNRLWNGMTNTPYTATTTTATTKTNTQFNNYSNKYDENNKVNNFIFSPKRGELKLFGDMMATNAPITTTNYWTRS